MTRTGLVSSSWPFVLIAISPWLLPINGVAVGAGVASRCVQICGLRRKAPPFTPGYIRAGTSPDGGLSWTLPTLLGHEAALRFLWDPRMVPAEEAQARGLVGEVVVDDAFSGRRRSPGSAIGCPRSLRRASD